MNDNGKEVQLKKGAEVEVIIEADPADTVAKEKETE